MRHEVKLGVEICEEVGDTNGDDLKKKLELGRGRDGHGHQGGDEDGFEICRW
jgi:hypothetical protein